MSSVTETTKELQAIRDELQELEDTDLIPLISRLSYIIGRLDAHFECNPPDGSSLSPISPEKNADSFLNT